MMRRKLYSVVTTVAAVLVLSAGDCGVVDPTDYNFDPSQGTEYWAFVTRDGTGQQRQAKVIMKGCTASQCTGATFESDPSQEWRTPVGDCTLLWHISGQVTGDLISFTLNGSNCATTIQGRSDTGGRIDGKYGTASVTVGTNAMSWNGISTLFGNGQPQSFSGSGFWVAFRCGHANVDCDFPYPAGN
jgi:hypothetical protein